MDPDVQITEDQRRAVEEFRRRHRTAVLALLFTDVERSTALRGEMGDLPASVLFERHNQVIREVLAQFGEAQEIGKTDLVAALLVTQFIGIPCAIAFGRMAKFVGAKRSILFGIGTYMLICVGGYFMTAPKHFYMLAVAIALVQGGTQAISRSLYGAMVPRARTTEFFGFSSTSSKFAGLFGLVLFAVIGQWKDSTRPSLLFLITFFVVGGLLLARVKEQDGIRIAREEDAAAGPRSSSPSTLFLAVPGIPTDAGERPHEQ